MPPYLTRLSDILKRCWQPPASPVALPGWLLVILLLTISAVLYWLNPALERFELWFNLPPAPALPIAWLSVLGPLQNYLPDFAWALMVACAVRDLIWATHWRVPMVLVLCAAASWELGQLLLPLPGYFDEFDLLLSVSAGVIALCLPEAATEQELA